MLVINFPIEPMENRYSIQWDVWFRGAFTRNEIPFVTVLGYKFANGEVSPPDNFCNPLSAMKYKASQLEQAINLITYRDGPIVLFFQDGWFPGTEMFRYIVSLSKPQKEIKIAAFWHAGSYLGTDILNTTNQSYWANHSEKSWLLLADKIFLGSEYHLEKMLKGCDLFERDGKFIVTGVPVEVPGYPRPTINRPPLVVFPHRLSNDKHPEIFDKLAAEPMLRNVQFKKTMEHCRDKKAYYSMLSIADVAISCAEHETFGISMAEATMSGAIPIVPNTLCYPEFYPDEYRYNDYEDMVTKVMWATKLRRGVSKRFTDAFNPQKVTDHICKEIKSMFPMGTAFTKYNKGF